MGDDPKRTRAELEQARTEMGDTVDALGYKADVKGRAKDKLTGAKDRVFEKLSAYPKEQAAQAPMTKEEAEAEITQAALAMAQALREQRLAREAEVEPEPKDRAKDAREVAELRRGVSQDIERLRQLSR